MLGAELGLGTGRADTGTEHSKWYLLLPKARYEKFLVW